MTQAEKQKEINYSKLMAALCWEGGNEENQQYWENRVAELQDMEVKEI